MDLYGRLLVACTHADVLLRAGQPIERVVVVLAQMPLGRVSKALAATDAQTLDASLAGAHPFVKRLITALSSEEPVAQVNNLRVVVLSELESSVQERARSVKRHMGLLIFTPFAPLLVLLITLLGRGFTTPLLQPPYSLLIGYGLLAIAAALLLRFAWRLR